MVVEGALVSAVFDGVEGVGEVCVGAVEGGDDVAGEEVVGVAVGVGVGVGAGAGAGAAGVVVEAVGDVAGVVPVDDVGAELDGGVDDWFACTP